MNPQIISVCSKCNVKSPCCKLIQYNKSKNYNIICNTCYLMSSTDNNINDVVLNIINYQDMREDEPVSTFQKYKIKTIKCCHCIKIKAQQFGHKFYICLKSIHTSFSNMSCKKRSDASLV